MRAPAANRRTLVLLAGLLWSAVGLVLIAMATRWLALSENSVIVFVAVGFVCGVAVYRFGFAGLARKNLVRIYEQAPGKDKVCIFAFQNTRSYIIIFVMMLMCYTLRHLPCVFPAKP